jgi:hypothetical protein
VTAAIDGQFMQCNYRLRLDHHKLTIANGNLDTCNLKATKHHFLMFL